jgi:stress response protein SCP2
VAEGVPVVDERAFLRLLDDVRPGTPHEQPAIPVPAPAAVPPVPAPDVTADQPDGGTEEQAADTAPAVPAVPPQRRRTGGPLAGRRVLALGGTHPQAAARTRIVELGGAAAVNLSAGVTDVVLLPGGDGDRRMRRITSLEIPVHAAGWLDAPTAAAHADRAGRWQAPRVLPRGGVVDLPGRAPGALWTVTASWAQRTACEIDVVAFALDEDGQVSRDEDFVFYGTPENPDGTVRLLGDGPTEQTVALDVGALPPAVRKVVVAAAVDGTPAFGDVGAVQITTGPGDGTAPLAQAALDAATTERTLLLAEIYRRGPLWRLRAVGQGYDHGLAELARGYEVDVAEERERDGSHHRPARAARTEPGAVTESSLGGSRASASMPSSSVPVETMTQSRTPANAASARLRSSCESEACESEACESEACERKVVAGGGRARSAAPAPWWAPSPRPGARGGGSPSPPRVHGRDRQPVGAGRRRPPRACSEKPGGRPESEARQPGMPCRYSDSPMSPLAPTVTACVPYVSGLAAGSRGGGQHGCRSTTSGTGW